MYGKLQMKNTISDPMKRLSMHIGWILTCVMLMSLLSQQGSYVSGKMGGAGNNFLKVRELSEILESVRKLLKFVKMSWICQGIFLSVVSHFMFFQKAKAGPSFLAKV